MTLPPTELALATLYLPQDQREGEMYAGKCITLMTFEEAEGKGMMPKFKHDYVGIIYA